MKRNARVEKNVLQNGKNNWKVLVGFSNVFENSNDVENKV